MLDSWSSVYLEIILSLLLQIGTTLIQLSVWSAGEARLQPTKQVEVNHAQQEAINTQSV
jgi:hypothetical protein